MLTYAMIMVRNYLATLKREEGQGMAEYGLILALVACGHCDCFHHAWRDISELLGDVGTNWLALASLVSSVARGDDRKCFLAIWKANGSRGTAWPIGLYAGLFMCRKQYRRMITRIVACNAVGENGR